VKARIVYSPIPQFALGNRRRPQLVAVLPPPRRADASCRLAMAIPHRSGQSIAMAAVASSPVWASASRRLATTNRSEQLQPYQRSRNTACSQMTP